MGAIPRTLCLLLPSHPCLVLGPSLPPALSPGGSDRCGDPGTDPLCPIPTPRTCFRIVSPWLLESRVLPPPSIPLILILSISRRCHPDIPLAVQPSRDVTPLFRSDPSLPDTAAPVGAICDYPKDYIRAGFPFPLQQKAVQGQSLWSPTPLGICLSLCHPSPVLLHPQLSSCWLGSTSGFMSLGSGFPSTHGSS